MCTLICRVYFLPNCIMFCRYNSCSLLRKYFYCLASYAGFSYEVLSIYDVYRKTFIISDHNVVLCSQAVSAVLGNALASRG